ncbi:hypothetical protein D3C76_1620850 [compost metagenome]
MIAMRWATRNSAAVPAKAKVMVSKAVPRPVGIPSAARINAKMPAPQGPAMLIRQNAVS